MPEALHKPDDGNAPRGFVLTDDHRMLLDIRDTLYEGSWDDFKTDLVARCESKPHVFETVPDSGHMREVIRYHLELIAQMRDWEKMCGTVLRGSIADS